LTEFLTISLCEMYALLSAASDGLPFLDINIGLLRHSASFLVNFFVVLPFTVGVGHPPLAPLSGAFSLLFYLSDSLFFFGGWWFLVGFVFSLGD